MRVPVSWLTEYCDPGLSVADLAGRLAMRTCEVERVSTVGPGEGDGFVAGMVLAVEPHPDADRLSVCEVDTGDGTRTIVCGAPNVAAGQAVPVALPGAVLPGGLELGVAKLRGIESHGMILSEAELGIGDEADGILVLDTDPEPGSGLAESLGIGDRVLELEVTSNRIDCLGVYGVAREVHAITGAPLVAPPWAEDAAPTADGEVGDHASLAVEVPELCPRFTARVFTAVTVGPSPLWLRARLTAAGQRPINNVVDITNYVMLMTAQPLHAFDLGKVPGGELIVRTAEPGESMTTLDGVERALTPTTVVVCDRDGPTGIAGIIGGLASEVSDSTTSVLLEVASWNGVNILRTSRDLGVRSEASNRFEKQLHPELAMRAQRIASLLLVELCGARLVPGTLDAAAEIPAPRRVAMRAEKVESLLGVEIAPDLCEEYLERLGFSVERHGEDLEAEVPLHRHYDVEREVDLVEEVGRIHGYDEHLPATLPAVSHQVGGLSRDQQLRRRAEDAMLGLGFDAVVTLSLTAPDLPARLRIPPEDPRARPIRVSNPLSREHSVLRTTLLGPLLDAARHNLAHGAERVALCESGRAYLAEGGTPGGGFLAGEFVGERPAVAHEPHRLGAVAVGELGVRGWRGAPPIADFFAMKGVLESLAGGLGAELAVSAASEPFLHPGRAGRVRFGEFDAGWLGELHPLVCRAWSIEAAAGFEIDLAPLSAASEAGLETFEDVISYPAVHQDIAVVVDDEVSAERVRAAVLTGGGELLRSATIFDLYRGDQVGGGRKSLALGLEFRAADRTLTDAEVSELRKSIESELAKIGGSRRG